jgi:hypothetical protein
MRRFRQSLTTAVPATLLVGGTAGWAPARSESTLSGPLPGTAARPADGSAGQELPDPITATPSEVAALANLDGAAHDECFAPGTSTLTAFAAVADGDLR